MCQTKAVENQNTHSLLNNFFFKNCAIYEIMWKNILETGRPQMTIWCMHIACCIPKAINVHSEYVMLIAFPQQQWLHECASLLHYMCVACLVIFLYRSTSLLSSLETFPWFPSCKTPIFCLYVLYALFSPSTFVQCFFSLYIQQFLLSPLLRALHLHYKKQLFIV